MSARSDQLACRHCVRHRRPQVFATNQRRSIDADQMILEWSLKISTYSVSRFTHKSTDSDIPKIGAFGAFPGGVTTAAGGGLAIALRFFPGGCFSATA